MIIESEVMWLDERRIVSLAELVEVSGLREEELLDLANTGALPSMRSPAGGVVFSASVVTVARTACRLRDELELDVHGIGVALRLLERVRDLEVEVSRLRALLPRD